MTNRIVTAALLASALTIAAGASSALAAPPFIPGKATTSQKAPATASPRVAQADRGVDATRYAAAERAQPRAASFEGGATFVIIGSTAAIVLGVLLLVVLI